MDKHLWRPNRKLGCGILHDICHFQPTIDTYLWKVVVVPKEIQAYDVRVQLKLFSPWVTTMSSLKTMRRVSIRTRLGSRGSEFKMCYEAFQDLEFDLGLWRWNDQLETTRCNAIGNDEV